MMRKYRPATKAPLLGDFHSAKATVAPNHHTVHLGAYLRLQDDIFDDIDNIERKSGKTMRN